MAARVFFFMALVALVGVSLFVRNRGQAEQPAPLQSVAAAAVPGDLTGPAPAEGVIQVFKSPSCGCCGEWVKHMEEHGFTVEVKDVANMMAVKAELGVPGELGSCHTARIAGYLVEGHVPAEDIQRMLAEEPEIRGLAVPGMPIGSPGMEVEGRPADEYDVVAWDARGQTSVYASH